MIKNLPFIGENVGVEKDLFTVSTKILQSDSIAYVLDIANFEVRYYKDLFYDDRRHHWSRKTEYPIFSDSVLKPIYQVVFVSHKRCSSSGCELDSNKRYTNYRGLVNSFPELTDGGEWMLGSTEWITRKNSLVSKNFVFDWSDSLVVAFYQKCGDLASTDMGCCMGYVLDLQEEYADAYNRYVDKMNEQSGMIYLSHMSKDSIIMGYCRDDDGNGKLNWADSGSLYSSGYNDMKSRIEYFYNLYNKLLSNTSLKKQILQPKVLANGRSIQIENLGNERGIVIFDAQGRIVKKVVASSSNMDISISFAGRYFVMIGKSITAIDVK